ncbi:MAG TPA: hypothetical protein VLL95_03475 [Phnomibacter sp.]|nr:hypothetical protein [Phnomibacter sp.]
MKASLLFILITGLALLAGCEKTTDDWRTSPCVASQIRAFKNESICGNAAVLEFRFQQKLVYVFSNGNCVADVPAKVIDNACQTLGMLGGFPDNQMINGELFSNATFIRTVWKK